MSFLSSLSPEARAELAAFVDERVAAALEARDREPPKRWLSTAEAAVYVGCSVRAFRARIKAGRVPAHAVKRHGERLLIDREALDRDLKEQP